jgi:hypothetical protein
VEELRRRKGQFMLISAVMVSMLLMSTAATMSDLQQRSYSPMDKGYHVNSLKQAGQELDLAKKSDRKKFGQISEFLNSYSVNLNYWTEKRCYNVTLTSPSTETRLNCLGNGSVFNDAFEDGEYRDPAWVKTTRDGTAQVVNVYTPEGGDKALQLSEPGSQDTSYTINMQRNTDVWSQAWTAEGLFYTEELTGSTAQEHELVLHRGQGQDQRITVSLGFTDSSGNNRNFEILTEGLIDSNNGGENLAWQEDTWYYWQLSHDGSGDYEAFLWEEGQSMSSGYQIQASGDSPSGEAVAGVRVNGTSGRSFRVAHAFFKLQQG